MIFKKICSIVLIGIILAFPTACSKSTTVLQNVSSQIKEVKVQDTKLESINNVSELSGTLQPAEETIVSFQVSGTVNSVNVQEGSQVNANDILANVDSENYELQVVQAQANVDKASAGVSQTEKGVITKSDYEKYQNAMTSAQKKYGSSKIGLFFNS